MVLPTKQCFRQIFFFVASCIFIPFCILTWLHLKKMYPNLGEYPLPVWSYVIKTSRMLGISINTITSLCRNESLSSDQETALFTSTELDTQSLHCKKQQQKNLAGCVVWQFFLIRNTEKWASLRNWPSLEI